MFYEINCVFSYSTASLCLGVCLFSNAQIKYPVARKEVFDTIIYIHKQSDDYGYVARLQNLQLSDVPCFLWLIGKEDMQMQVQAVQTGSGNGNSYCGKPITRIFN
jgi:hypothetical protein